MKLTKATAMPAVALGRLYSGIRFVSYAPPASERWWPPAMQGGR